MRSWGLALVILALAGLLAPSALADSDEPVEVQPAEGASDEVTPRMVPARRRRNSGAGEAPDPEGGQGDGEGSLGQGGNRRLRPEGGEEGDADPEGELAPPGALRQSNELRDSGEIPPPPNQPLPPVRVWQAGAAGPAGAGGQPRPAAGLLASRPRPQPTLDQRPPVRPSRTAARLTGDSRRARAYLDATARAIEPPGAARAAQFDDLDRQLDQIINGRTTNRELRQRAIEEQALLHDTVRDTQIMDSPHVSSVSHAMELKRYGLRPTEAARIGAFSQANVDVKRPARELGSGALNTAYLVPYRRPGAQQDADPERRVFKRERRHGERMAIAEENIGIQRNDPRRGFRDLATTQLDDLLWRTDADGDRPPAFASTTRAEMAMHNNTLGTASQLARGTSPAGPEVTTNVRKTQQEIADAQEAYGADDGWLDRRNEEARQMSRATWARRRVNGRDEYFEETDAMYEINYDDPRLRRDLVRLQLLDSISGQVDRHAGNYFVERNATGDYVGMRGIDNDVAWGSRMRRVQGVNIGGSHLPRELPPFVDQETYGAVMALTRTALQQRLSGLLTQEEIDAAGDRLDEVQAHLRNLPPGRVLNDANDFARPDVTQALTARGPGGDWNSYVGRDRDAQVRLANQGAVLPYRCHTAPQSCLNPDGTVR